MKPVNPLNLLCRLLAAMVLMAGLSAHAAITFVGTSVQAFNSSAVSSLSFSPPAGATIGDLMLVQLAVRGGTGITSLTPPAGWNVAADRVDNGTSLMQIVYYRVVTASETTPYTWSFTSNRAAGDMIVYRGVDTSTPINASGGQANASSTSVTAPSITTTVTGTTLVGFFSTTNGGTSITAPCSPLPCMNGRYANQTGAGPNGVAIEISDATQAAAGATGSRTGTATVAADNIGQLVALKPAVTVSIPGRFNTFESSTAPASAITGSIYTKLAGTVFSLDIVALNTAKTAVLTGFTGAVKVELLNASNNAGAVDANNCNANWTTIQTLAVNPIFVAADNGRKTVSFTENNAWREVRVRVSYPATGAATAIGCSTDNFTIRPTGFTSVTSNMTNTGTSGTPKLRAGSDSFTLTAATGLSGYNGTPQIDNTALQAHVGAMQNGTLTGVFPAAINGTATGTNAFTYSEVGNFRLLGSLPAVGDAASRGVYDNDFTNVDAASGDCTSDYSNTLSGGKYGCSFGITANTAYFGRFYPDSFVLSAPSFINRNDISGCDIQTTGTIAATSNSLSVVSAAGYAVGDTLIVRGAGSSGADLQAAATAITGTTITLASAAATDVTGATVYKLAFSYEGESMLIGFTVNAFNGLTTPSVTKNYTGAWAGGTVSLQAGNSGTDLSSRMTLGITPAWSSGAYVVNAANAQLQRAAAPDGPYDNLQIGVAVSDPDGAPLLGLNMNPTAASCTAPACTGVTVANTRIRFGRLILSNAHGSELLALPVPAVTQYWNGKLFVTNTDDSCTKLTAANFVLAKSPAACTSTLSPIATFAAGKNSLTLSAPGAACRIDLTANLTAENEAYLQGNWSGAGYTQNPTARITFGIYKSGPVIYLRELH